MLGMSPNLGSRSNPSGITKEVHFGTKRAFLFFTNEARFNEEKRKKDRALCNKVDFMLGMSLTRGKRAKLVIPYLSPNQA